MNKLLPALILCFLLYTPVKGENYFIDLYDNQTVTACRGALLPTWLCNDAFNRKVYCNNESYTITFYSGTPGKPFRISFLPLSNVGYPTTDVFRTEEGHDILRIFDGPDTTSSQIAGISGVIPTPFHYTSYSGYMTIKFTSDGSITDYGWYAILGCEPDSCNNNPPSNDDCFNAPLICDIDGYCGNTSGWYTPDNYASLAANYSGPFCGSIENNGWIRFIPTETIATLRINSYNCDVFDAGIQAMLFASSDCNSFTEVSTCATQVGSSGEFTISNTVPLTIGATYYLMIDGYAGNTCDYVVNAVAGVRVLDITGPPDVCIGSTTELTLVNAEPGSTFLWEPASAITGGLTDSIIIASPSVTTIYTCRVTAPGECSVKYKTYRLVVTNKMPVSVSISGPSGPVCQGSAATFTAIPVRGGGSPAFQWYLDSSPVGTNSSTYSNSSLSPGSYEISVVLTSNDTCIVGPATATSSVFSFDVISSAVSVTATPSANPVCQGTPVTFTANPVNGGPSPTFQWLLNNVNIPGATGSTYTTSSLSNGSNIRVRMTSNSTCRSVSIVFSPNVTMTVLPRPNVSASYDLSACPDTEGYSASLTGNNPSPGTGVWSVFSGPGTLSGTTYNNSSVSGLSVSGGTTTLKWLVTGANGCRDSVLLPITPSAVNNNEVSVFSPFYCITCNLEDGKRYYYYDPDGKLAGTILDVQDGTSLGLVELCIYLDYDVAHMPTAFDVVVAPDSDGYSMPFLPRHWTVNVPVQGNAEVNAFFTQAELQAHRERALGTPYQFFQPSSLVTENYDNGAQAYVPPGADGSVTGTPSIVGYPSPVVPFWGFAQSTSGFSTTHIRPLIDNQAPLPIELISFQANAEYNHIALIWITASEINNDFFILQRSTDAFSFTEIAHIPGGGNSTNLMTYSHEDNSVVKGLRYYYRLKQVDFDGSYTYSDVVSAALEYDKDFIISPFFPNPSEAKTTLTITSSIPRDAEMMLYDISGNKVTSYNYQIKEGINNFQFDLSGLDSGVYFWHLYSADRYYVRKLIRM